MQSLSNTEEGGFLMFDNAHPNTTFLELSAKFTCSAADGAQAKEHLQHEIPQLPLYGHGTKE